MKSDPEIEQKSQPSSLSKTALIFLVGLGNPGPHYQNNRHNVGFMAIDRIASHYHYPPFKPKDKTLFSEGMIVGKKVILIKPIDFMNRSGKALSSLVRFYKVPPEAIIVIHDELDLAPGKIRIKQGGGAGGHNGVKDLDAHVGNQTWRIRIGVGHPGHRDAVTAHVLSNFSKIEHEELDILLNLIAEEIPALLQDDKELFLTSVARGMQKE